eukprot:TRINITY_DN54625_c0_g1_i1.p1 TRINITY_DN54625_c0_g1~~TRINITY_DN54625_c0_g1_i1.p1  ORF type:complete len:277 (+),score=72.33 TRINITY_DN54625_c0_g1_i1:121-831(+)
MAPLVPPGATCAYAGECATTAVERTLPNGGKARGVPADSPLPEHSGIFQLHMQAAATLHTAEVREAVKLPPGIHAEEWIASQVLGVYEEAVQLVCLLDEVCTCESCPVMNAGKRVSYSWADERNPKPISLSAPDYMRTLLEYANGVLSDRNIVPIDGSEFSAKFLPAMKTLLKRIFRIYAHAYVVHFEVLRSAGVEAHLNCCFKRFLFFVREFDLVSMQDMAPLADLVRKFTKSEK